MRVLCWDCPNTYEVASDMEGNFYQRGLIKRRSENDADSAWIGLCGSCTLQHARADDPTKTIPFKRKPEGAATIQGIHDETARILLTADELREHDLSLGREEAIHLAIEVHFDVEREPNANYREFLRWRKPT